MQKYLYSIIYYILTTLIFFTEIKPSRHYLEEHQYEVPWHEVVEVILRTKNPKKNGDTYEIKNGYYIIFAIRKGKLVVINAKRT